MFESPAPAGLDSKALENAFIRLAREGLIAQHGRRFDDPPGDWPSNAIREQQGPQKFDAIIFKERRTGDDAYLTPAQLSDELARWRNDADQAIRRKADLLASAAYWLIETSSEIMYIDPYFLWYTDEKRKRRWESTLREFLRRTFYSKTAKLSVEFHTRAEERETPGLRRKSKIQIEEFVKSLESLKVHNWIPAGKAMTFIRWDEFNDKREKIHARYVLTERGGLRYDAGLDEGSATQTTDISRVGTLVREQRRSDYAGWRELLAGRTPSVVEQRFHCLDAVTVADGKYTIHRREVVTVMTQDSLPGASTNSCSGQAAERSKP